MSDLPLTDDRRHDLDALRSFAMLLGIGLHAALAYIGTWWFVTDDRTSAGLGVFVSAIHGFRMPLFFLLSGFFSAMLWKKRGLFGLMRQRVWRILIPFLLGCSMIVPTMSAVTAWASSQALAAKTSVESEGETRERAPTPDIWTVAAYGDMEGLRAYTAESEVLNTPDPMYGVTALGWTVVKDMPEATAYLLSIGADPSARYKDQNTPMHTACFFGRADIAELLLRGGADISIKSAAGEVPADAMRHNQQTTEFIANMLSVPIDFEVVAAGRERIRELVASGEYGEAQPATDLPAVGGGGFLGWLLNPGFLSHLWFLWFLCWLNAGFAVAALIVRVLPSVRLPGVLFGAPWCLLWLVPLTMLTQMRMHNGGALPGFGPDTSAGLVPVPHVLLHYGIFFGFGALAFVSRGSAAKLGRFWFVMLPIAVVALPIGTMFGYQEQKAAELVPDEDTRRRVSALVQVLYAWLMSFGMLGIFETLLTKNRPWIRYVSDSSYWLYLIHLPLVIVGQALLLRSDLPPLVEFSLLTLVSTVLLLASYQYLVRYTVIGTLLNGKRTRPGKALASSTAS